MGFDLGALLKDVSNLGTGREQIEYIKLDLIDEDPNNFYALDKVDALADNIATCGLQQPIRVRPIPDSDHYMIVSGHRRRAAVSLLAQENPEQWGEVACIVTREELSPALQQLQLIFANSSTRVMTSAEISEQAVQVEKLLYQLKEEGYEFPGRMRDHVAQAVNASKSKLARLKVIRENLAANWHPAWKDGTLAENTAYELAKMPRAHQSLLFAEKSRTNANLKYLYTDDVKKFAERVAAIETMQCKDFGGECQNRVAKQSKAATADRYGWFHCDNKCCKDCPKLIRCKAACPKLKQIVTKMRADAKANAAAEAERIAERDKPTLDLIRLVYERVGTARKATGASIADLMAAQKKIYSSSVDDKQQTSLENGTAKLTVNTPLPFGYSFYPSNAQALCRVADLLQCSTDYLLGRSESYSGTAAEPEFVPGAWYPVTVEPPVGVELILIDVDGYVDDGKYNGSGVFKTYGDSPVVLWGLFPKQSDAAEVAPASTGWRTGNPEAYGTYAAYVQIPGARKALLKELLWDGDKWLLHGERISDDTSVQCWMEQPDL